MDYRIVDTLRTLCIKNDYFDAGTNSQYERMFELAKDVVKNAADAHLAVTRIATAIWICSADAGYNEVYSNIEAWFDERRKEMSAR